MFVNCNYYGEGLFLKTTRDKFIKKHTHTQNNTRPNDQIVGLIINNPTYRSEYIARPIIIYKLAFIHNITR